MTLLTPGATAVGSRSFLRLGCLRPTIRRRGRGGGGKKAENKEMKCFSSQRTHSLEKREIFLKNNYTEIRNHRKISTGHDENAEEGNC